MMKKIIAFVSLSLLFFACSEGSNGLENTNSSSSQPQICNAENLESTAECLCAFYNKQNNASDLTDDEYDKLRDEFDAFNRDIDDAIAAAIYSEIDLVDAVDKICP